MKASKRLKTSVDGHVVDCGYKGVERDRELEERIEPAGEREGETGGFIYADSERGFEVINPTARVSIQAPQSTVSVS